MLPPAAHDDLAQAQAPFLLQRGMDHPVAFFGKLVFRHDVIGPLVIARVDFLQLDELLEVQRFLAFELDCIQFLGLQRDVGVFGNLIGLDDIVLINLISISLPPAVTV